RDPQSFLYLGEWHSREAYLQSDLTPLSRLDELSTSRAERWLFHQLDLREQGTERPQAITASVFAVAPLVTAALIAMLLEQAGSVVHQSPGFVLRALYQDLD